MNDHTTISVIVPVYNIEKYIEKCICSIVSQTYDNLEIILVDDGSTDDYALKDSRITVIHKPNGGLSDARNHGLDIAKGDVISFIDGDDRIHPQMYEILMYAMEVTKADVVECRYTHVEKDLDNEFSVNNINAVSMSGRDAYIKSSYITSIACDKLYKKEIFDNIRYPVGKFHEDEYVFHEMIYKADRIAFVDIPLYFYLIRDNSIMSNMSPTRIEDVLDALDQREQFARSVDWIEAIPVAVRQYCDYCVNIYKEIEEGKHPQLDKTIERELIKRERNKVKSYMGVNIGKRNYLFALFPRITIMILKSKKNTDREKRYNG